MIRLSVAVCKQFVNGGALDRKRMVLLRRLDQWTLVTTSAMAPARQGLGTNGMGLAHPSANIAGGEHNPQIRPQPLGSLGQFGSAHARHADIRKQNPDLRMGLDQLEGLVAVVGVEHMTAEVFHDAHRGGPGLGHVLDHKTAIFLFLNNAQSPERNSLDMG